MRDSGAFAECELNGNNRTVAEAMKDVVVVREGEFVGFAAPSTFLADQALNAVAKTATWKTISLS